MAREAAHREDVAGGRGDPGAYVDDSPEPRLYFGWGKRLPMIR